MLRVGLVQHQHRGSKKANLDYAAQQIAALSKDGVVLVVLQELQSEFYFCQSEQSHHFDLAEDLQGSTVKTLSDLAKKYRVVIVSTIFEKRCSGIYHNTAVVLDQDGSLAGYYRKMHIPDDPGFYEKFYFTPGDALPDKQHGFAPITTSLGKLGVMVCWDQWFPEAARLMALAGAELLIFPTAIGWDRSDSQQEQLRQQQAWQLIQRSHAVANNLPVISCNRVGYEPSSEDHSCGIDFWGRSFITGPQGEILAESTSNQEENLMADLNLEDTEKVRRSWPFLRDRRVDAYGNLVQRVID
ncbi:MAG: acyltransferase [Moraxellaceae bacterium]|nr:MAG: acyltransferase [Moraxellaceae bacterium]